MTNTLAIEADAPEVEAGLDDGAHMDEFRAPEIEDEGGAAPDDVRPVGEDGEAIGGEVELISEEAFYEVFREVFGLPGLFSQRWKPFAIQPDEIGSSRAAATACYRLFKVYLPSLLKPGGETAALVAAAAPFALAKLYLGGQIIGQMKAERIAARQPANRNGAPGQFKSQRGGGPGDPMAWMDAQEAAA